jgi:FkbM family methyltransferase
MKKYSLAKKLEEKTFFNPRNISFLQEFFGIYEKRFFSFLTKVKWNICKIFGCEFIRSKYGVILKKNYSDETFRYYVEGAYGFYLWNVLKEIQYPFVFLDVGANQGLYSIGAAKNPNLKKCFAFEPMSLTASLLKENLEANQVQKKCEIVQKAISFEGGVGDIFYECTHTGAASLSNDNLKHRETQHLLREQIRLIESKELDDIINVEEVNIFVKIDVEGYEEIVLNEIFKTSFSDRISEIFIEIDERWTSSGKILSFLETKNFISTKIGEGPSLEAVGCAL